MANAAPSAKGIPGSVSADFTDAVYSGTITTSTLHNDLFTEHYTRFINRAQQGYGKSFASPADAQEFTIMQRLDDNLRSFAAHKQRRMIEELQAAKQKATSKEGYDDKAMSIINRHHKRYLKVEVDAAGNQAQMAEWWNEAKRRYDRTPGLYPNLKYVTANDERVRESHRALDGIVRPFNDPFWHSHTPPIGYGCRCKLVQTDGPASEGDPDLSELKIPKGFGHQPGETGEVFNGQHPYYDISAKAKATMAKEVNRLLAAMVPIGYFADTKLAEAQFRHLKKAPTDTLGHDPNSGGTLLLSENHSASGIDNELPVCKVLRDQGHSIRLIDEKTMPVHYDLWHSGQLWDIKRFRNATNDRNCIRDYFKDCQQKSKANILIHLDKAIGKEELRGHLSYAIRQSPWIKQCMVVWNDGRSIRLDAIQMHTGQW